MPALIYHRIRDRFSILTKKLVPEVLVSFLAIVLVVALFSNVAKVPSAAERTGFDGRIAAANTQKTVDFMERVALSHIIEPKPSTAAAVPAAATTASAAKASRVATKTEPTAVVASVAKPTALAASSVAPHRSHLASAATREKPRAAAIHAATAAAVATVLPPPRPPFAAPEPPTIVAESPVVVSEPQEAQPLRPLRYGVHLVAQLVNFVPASGTRVVEGVASIGGALASFAKKL